MTYDTQKPTPSKLLYSSSFIVLRLYWLGHNHYVYYVFEPTNLNVSASPENFLGEAAEAPKPANWNFLYP